MLVKNGNKALASVTVESKTRRIWWNAFSGILTSKQISIALIVIKNTAILRKCYQPILLSMDRLIKFLIMFQTKVRLSEDGHETSKYYASFSASDLNLIRVK